MPPFSHLAGGPRIGPEFFAERGWVVERSPSPSGLVDRLSDFDRDVFDSRRVPTAIAGFYERTDEHELRVTPRWSLGFRSAARLYRSLAARVGQVVLPTRPEGEDDPIESRVFALDEQVDGRAGVRAWVRRYGSGGGAMYVAAYATHRHEGTAYMNIAFPLPGGNLSSILRMDPLDSGDGRLAIELTTRRSDRTGHAGIWWVRADGRGLALPLEETIRVYTPDMPTVPADLTSTWPGVTVVARHDLWLLGLHYLRLDYAIRRAAGA